MEQCAVTAVGERGDRTGRRRRLLIKAKWPCFC